MAVRSLQDEIALLSSSAEEKGVLPAVIPVEDIVVSDWVRMKCRFGCKGYGKHLSCPPYTPDPEEMRRILHGYRTMMLLRFDDDPAHPTFNPGDIPLDFPSLLSGDDPLGPGCDPHA